MNADFILKPQEKKLAEEIAANYADKIKELGEDVFCAILDEVGENTDKRVLKQMVLYAINNLVIKTLKDY